MNSSTFSTFGKFHFESVTRICAEQRKKPRQAYNVVILSISPDTRMTST
jgi:hypothetical protein